MDSLQFSTKKVLEEIKVHEKLVRTAKDAGEKIPNSLILQWLDSHKNSLYHIQELNKYFKTLNGNLSKLQIEKYKDIEPEDVCRLVSAINYDRRATDLRFDVGEDLTPAVQNLDKKRWQFIYTYDYNPYPEESKQLFTHSYFSEIIVDYAGFRLIRKKPKMTKDDLEEYERRKKTNEN